MLKTALASLVLLLVAACTGPESGPERPNLLLIVVDDLGVNDLGAWGNPEVVTPHIDALAGQGVRFTRHYTDTTCATSRAMMLTGQEPSRLGFRPVHQGISPETVTVADALAEAGYYNLHIGKWHLGYSTRLAWPLAQGFDAFFGFLDQHLLRGPHGEGTWQPARPTHRNPWLQRDNQPPRPHRGYLDELLTAEAEAFLGSRSAARAPWFLNLWLYAPHSPLQPMPEFAGRYPDTPRGRYLALLEQVDHHVGRVLAALEASGQAKQTLVLLASDNGGTARVYPSNAPFDGRKMDYREGAVRTPLIVRWPGQSAGTVVDSTVTAMDYFPTLLAAAGVQPPAGLRGRDLARVADGSAASAGALFWESVSPEGDTWAVLSADGRWRLSEFLDTPLQLNDLQSDPSGRHNVLAAHPRRAARLQQQFQQWQRQARELPLVIEQLSVDGKARVTGHSLQRAPGYAGHTFAIGVSGEGEGVLASQQGQWSLVREGSRLRVQIHGQEMVSAPIDWAPAACNALILSSEFRYSLMLPDTDFAEVRLYVNGRTVLAQRRNHPELPPDHFIAPTLIGHDLAGRSYSGRLGRPLVYNRSTGILPSDLAEHEAELIHLGNRVCTTM